MNQIVEKPKAVSPRIEQERQRRRRRDDLGFGRLSPLAVHGQKDPNYVYRWINDEPGRVHRLTELDDWDVVTAAQLGAESNEKDRAVGSGVERIVDRATGKRAILVRKPKEFYLADKLKEQGLIDETDAALKRGRPMSPEALSGPAAYIPEGGISIRDGRKG